MRSAHPPLLLVLSAPIALLLLAGCGRPAPPSASESPSAAAVWKLDHTGIRGMVPMIAATHFPEDPAKAHVLPVDYPLTYERLASYGFDPDAEYLYALELL